MNCTVLFAVSFLYPIHMGIGCHNSTCNSDSHPTPSQIAYVSYGLMQLACSFINENTFSCIRLKRGVRSLPALQPVPACLVCRMDPAWQAATGRGQKLCADPTVWVVVLSSHHFFLLGWGVASAESNQKTPKNLTEKLGKKGHSIHFMKTERIWRLMNTANYKPVSEC